jgi:hypothetical protein
MTESLSSHNAERGRLASASGCSRVSAKKTFFPTIEEAVSNYLATHAVPTEDRKLLI